MKAIILAAGKGSRLGEICRNKPKCLMTIEDNTLLEIQINTLHACGIEDISVVTGYHADKIDLPGLKYYKNPDYAKTNVLHSLFAARKELSNSVLVLYSDIIFEEQVVKRLIDSTHDIALGVMVNWQEAAKQRNAIALDDLEMVYFDAENRIERIGKGLDEKYQTQGQFIGMVKYSPRGSEILKTNYDRVKKHYSKSPLGEAKTFEKAWQTDLFQEMTELGIPLHCVIIERGWMEIDTPEDYQRAQTDTEFVRRLVKKKTDWSIRAKLYNDLDWVNRDELLSAIVKIALGLNGKKTLDLGTGTGKVLMALKQSYPDGRFYGVDISKSMMEKIDKSEGFDLSVGSVEQLNGFKSNDFDLVTARMVFHHVEKLEDATAQVHRVLKPGGRFILCEGNPPDLYSMNFYKEMFRFKEDRKTFLSDDLINLLVRRGFRDINCRVVVTRDMSLNNWLDKSGLPFRNVDIIKKMHRNCDSRVQQAYNMKFTDDDIIMDWKFSIVSGTK